MFIEICIALLLTSENNINITKDQQNTEYQVPYFFVFYYFELDFI